MGGPSLESKRILDTFIEETANSLGLEKQYEVRGNVLRSRLIPEALFYVKVSLKISFWGINPNTIDNIVKKGKLCFIILLDNSHDDGYFLNHEFIMRHIKCWSIGGREEQYKITKKDLDESIRFDNIEKLNQIINNNR